MSKDIDLQELSDDQPEEEHIYANLHRSTPPKNTGPRSSTILRYRCAVVCLGGLCLLLAIIIGLGVLWLKTGSEANQIHTKLNNQLQQLQKTCKNFTEVSSFDNNTVLETSCSILSREKSQLEANYNTLTREKSQLETNYNTLSSEKSQLETNYNTLSSERSQLETNYNTLSSEKSQLETNYNTLSREKSSLQARYDRVNRERSQLQDRYDSLTRDKSQLQERCDAITAERDTLLQRTVTAKQQIAKYAVDVTLDPDTAHDKLILSADRKQVNHGVSSQNRRDNPKRFTRVVIVLGRQGFSTGRFYYEVQVSGKTEWTIGVARESIDRVGDITYSPTNGYWAIWLRDSQYLALAGPSVTLSLKEKPERVGVFVDYAAGLVSFYDADRWSLIYSYKGVSFREKIYPFFCPSLHENGKNSAPLVITPVSCFK